MVYAYFFLALLMGGINSSDTPAPKLHVEHITVADGLPENSIVTMLQDRHGFLWFGTANGLVKFDGYTYQTYKPNPQDPNSLSDVLVVSLFEDAEGILWVGTAEGGLNRFNSDTERFQTFKHEAFDPNSLSSNDVRVVVGTPDGILWVGTEHGLNRFDPETEEVKRYRHEPQQSNTLVHDVVKSIQVHPDGSLWIGTYGGLNHFNPETEQFTTYTHDTEDPATLSSDHISHVYLDPQQPEALWIGTGDFFNASLGDGLNRLDIRTGRVERYGRKHGLSDTNIMVVNSFAEGMLSIGTRHHGLFRFDPETEVFTPFAEATLTGKTVLAIHEDPSGLIWAGTVFTGLYKIDRFANKVVSVRLEEKGRIHALHEDAQGVIWLGTSTGLYQWDPEGQHVVSTGWARDYGDKQVVGALATGPAGTLWVGTSEGLYQYDPQKGVVTPYPYWQGRLAVLGLWADENGHLWMGTRGEGLVHFDPSRNQFTPYRFDELGAYNSNIVSSLSPIGQNKLWLQGAEEGRAFDTEQRQFVEGPAWLSAFQRIRPMMQDRSGHLWLGSAQWGLYRWDPRTGTGRFFSEDHGLGSDLVWELLEDDSGDIWVATAKGLSRFNPATEAFTTYDEKDGVQVTHHRYLTSLKGQDGRLYFGGDKEVIIVDPDNLPINTYPPPVAITDVELIASDHQGVKPVEGTLRLAYGQHDMTIRFAALSYRFADQNQYAYRLEGYETVWRNVREQRTATYTNLAPGTYTFQVKAANNDGIWNTQPTTLTIIIRPPWWQTRWAYGSYLVGLVLLVLGIIRVRVRYLEQRNRHLEATVALRTAEIARQQHQLAQQHADLVAQHARMRAAKDTIQQQATRLAEVDATKSRFFANLSHEFRTPLTLIIGPLVDMQQGFWGNLQPTMQHQVSAMVRQGKRLLRLINQLLDLAKLEAGHAILQPKPGDLIPFTEDVVRSFAPLAEREGVTLQFTSQQSTAPCLFDADALEKVLANLLANAFQFTQRHGKIRVSLEAEGGAPSKTVLVVKDTGQGIPAGKLPHIFDRFASTPSGTGIGLALVRELVDLHGGTVEAASEIGFGTTITVRLPLDAARNPLSVMQPAVSTALTQWVTEAADDESTHVTPVGGDGAVATPQGTVLVVEDNAEVRAYVSVHLRKHYTVLEASDGKEGWTLVTQHAVDLVISDVMLPELDGLGLCERIKAHPIYNTLPVILLTARGATEDKIRGLMGGADDYIAKPFVGAELHVRVANLLRSRRHLRERFSAEVRVGPDEIIVPSYEAALLERVRNVIEARLSETTFGVEAVANEVGLSARQLQRRIKASTNLSVAAYIRQMRLQRAAQLLAQKVGTVGEISYAVGFKNADHFSTLFRKTFGLTPSQYAENATQGLADVSLPESKAH